MSLTSGEHTTNELRAMGKQRILLVDDEPDILDFIEYNLVKEGYDVHTANNDQRVTGPTLSAQSPSQES